MALPVVVAEQAIADELVAKIVELAKGIKLGPACDRATDMGPVVNAGHRDSVVK